MKQGRVVFDVPLTERFKLMLQVERLMGTQSVPKHAASHADFERALVGLATLLNTLARWDVKTDCIKEIERHIGTLTRLQQTPSVDHITLGHLLGQLDEVHHQLGGFGATVANTLHRNEFLNTIRQRLLAPSGLHFHEVPSLQAWFALPEVKRLDDIHNWWAPIQPLGNALSLILQLTRNSQPGIQVTSNQGSYQHTLSPQAVCPLIQVELIDTPGVFPEVSSSRNRISIRLKHYDYLKGESCLLDESIAFGLKCCVV